MSQNKSTEDTTLTLCIPGNMMPDLLAHKDEGETLHDCVLELLWLGVLRMKQFALMADTAKTTARYLLFRGNHFYAAGGWNDFAGSHSSLEEAIAVGPKQETTSRTWRHVVDTYTLRVVFADPPLDQQGQDDQENQVANNNAQS